MLKLGEIHVWRMDLDAMNEEMLPAANPGEAARASRFHTENLARRYLRSHRALRAVLARFTAGHLNFAVSSTGKPYLPGEPNLKFNLAHSHEMALIAVTLEYEVGVDIERLRYITDYAAIADHFLPPSEALALRQSGEANCKRDFFRRWTRFEAMLKARGVGLYGAGEELGGDWTVEELDIAPDFAAAVAVERPGLSILIHDFGADV
jgi:4'-phosphopantetheinyl transferase